MRNELHMLLSYTTIIAIHRFKKKVNFKKKIEDDDNDDKFLF